MVPARPGFIGRPGWERSNAWIWLLLRSPIGHTKVGITLDLYWHVPPNMLMDAVALLDDALQAAVQKLS